MREFTARLTRPIHVGETITLAGYPAKDGQAAAWVQNAQGAVCGQVEAVFG
jgi:3-methylfumaryl-CoA hydratase